MKRTFRISLICTLLFAVGAFTIACGNDKGSAATGNTTGAIDAGVVDAGAAQDTATPKQGNECTADTACISGICHRGACTKTCASTADCDAGDDCSLDSKSRLVCSKPLYPAGIGQLCGHDGKCQGTLKCVGRVYSAQAFCTAACDSDVDCPSNHQCADVPQAGKLCIKRNFCGECQFDGQCGAGNFCTKMTTGSFCTRSCQQGSTDCPRFSTCKDVGGEAGFQCVHNAGTCRGAAKQCDPCNINIEGECGGGLCLQYTHTKESFCAVPCSGSCSAGMKCTKVAADGREGCVPDQKTSPSCVGKIGSLFEVGAHTTDFAMVGMVDTNGDGELYNELPRIIHFSDYKGVSKLILMNVSAVWCTFCQQETKEIAKLLNQYNESDVTFFQVLFDGAKAGELITMPLLKAWQKKLKPAGASGMDPNRLTVVWNTQGGTPLNMLIDADTHEVLWKSNGYSKGALIAVLNKFIALKSK